MPSTLTTSVLAPSPPVVASTWKRRNVPVGSRAAVGAGDDARPAAEVAGLEVIGEERGGIADRPGARRRRGVGVAGEVGGGDGERVLAGRQAAARERRAARRVGEAVERAGERRA